MSLSKQLDSILPSRLSDIDTIVYEVNFTEKTFRKHLDREIAKFLHKTNNIGKTRSQICAAVKAARSSVYDSLNRMILMDLIECDHKIVNKTKKGRPSTIYYLKFVPQKQ